MSTDTPQTRALHIPGSYQYTEADRLKRLQRIWIKKLPYCPADYLSIANSFRRCAVERVSRGDLLGPVTITHKRLAREGLQAAREARLRRGDYLP